MTNTKLKKKIEYGDFQTPIELANLVCKKILDLNVDPDLIIEPTCGIGNFIKASLQTFTSINHIIGIEINSELLQKIREDKYLANNSRLILKQDNYFEFEYQSLINLFPSKEILVIGNFPWVTNSQQGKINSRNLPQKNNFQNHNGLDAITGKSNFDISEWMLIKTVNWLHQYNSCLAMLCKTSVARKVFNHIKSKNLNLSHCATYGIDSKKHFEANVDASLLFCKFEISKQQYFCDVFASLDNQQYQKIGFYQEILVKDINSFKPVSSLYTKKHQIKWRSGIKHDCAKVMELIKVNNKFINGFGNTVDIEESIIFPLLKGSDVANGKTISTNKYVLVTQKKIGEDTEYIKNFAPKTWQYLEAHSQLLDNRKSKIYYNKPRFSVFGIGEYTFKPWKIAICGLYKKLDFKLIGKIDNKSTLFDDTVYFISFESEDDAHKAYKLLTSKTAIDFYSSLIFWDEKRPIKTSILNSLNLKFLERFS